MLTNDTRPSLRAEIAAKLGTRSERVAILRGGDTERCSGIGHTDEAEFIVQVLDEYTRINISARSNAN